MQASPLWDEYDVCFRYREECDISTPIRALGRFLIGRTIADDPISRIKHDVLPSVSM